MIVKLAILSVLLLAHFLLPMAQSPLLAPESADVRGQVANGTEGA